MNIDYKNAQEIGLTQKDRWGDGIEHHSMSERLVRFIADHDFHDYGDYFCWKVGGDGDNGETLMYQIDAFFEYLDHSGQHKRNPNIKEFKELLQESNRVTRNMSSCHQMLKTPSVKKIIETGEVGIPFILEHYKKERGILWGIVLAHITDLNLIDEGYFKEKDRGKVDKLQKAWLKWGKDNGYILR